MTIQMWETLKKAGFSVTAAQGLAADSELLVNLLEATELLMQIPTESDRKRAVESFSLMCQMSLLSTRLAKLRHDTLTPLQHEIARKKSPKRKSEKRSKRSRRP